jgi:hypothetical protein
MGAEFQFAVLEAKTKNDAIKEVKAIIEKCQYDHGHAGHSGSFAEANGVEIISTIICDSNAEAEDLLMEKCQKWEAAIVIQTTTNFCVGAWCSS